MTTATITAPHEKGYALLQAQIAAKGGATAEALCQGKFGMSLADFHNSSEPDAAKVALYKECLQLPVFGLVKPVTKPPANPTEGARFEALCAALKTAGTDAHKRIAAHLRASTGKIALPLYDNDTAIPAESKAAFYRVCLDAIKTGDYTGLESAPGKGDRRVDAEVDAAKPEPEPEPAKRAVRPVAPVPEPEADDDGIAAAMAAMQAALAARKRPVAASFDEEACRRIVKAEVPTKAEIESMVGHAMNNGQFPVKRVEDMIATALKTAAPSFDVDSIVRPRIDDLLGSKLSDFLKRGVVPSTVPTKAAPVASPLASEVPAKDPTYVVSDEHKNLLKFLYAQSRTEVQNAFATGPHGCGKSSLGVVLAAEFGMPVLIMDCANIREQRDWFGYKYTEDGSVKWMRSQFDLCLEAGNHVILIDEITRCTDQIRNVLNPLLDHRRRTFLQERGDYITVGPGTIFFVTANEGMAYTGCSALDLALADRLAIRIEVNYLPEAQEAKLLVKRTGVDIDVAKRLAEIAATVRGKAIGFGATLTQTITTRQLIEAAKCYKGLGVDGLTPTMLNHFSADGGTDSERATVAQMLVMKFPKTC